MRSHRVCIFCLVLMFLEDKEAEDQFVLSELTEYVQSQYREEQIDWTIYRYRRHMIRVMKYCVACGILDVNDGSEEGFARMIPVKSCMKIQVFPGIL